MWLPQVERLSDTYRVIALDLPGHGVRAAERFTLDRAADVVAATIDAAAGGRAIVVGLSLGGYVAMHLAERTPERVRGLVLAGATAEPDGLRAAPYRALGWWMDAFQGHGLEALNRWFFRTRFAPAIAEPIVRRRVLGIRRSGGAALPRRPPVQAVIGSLSRARAHPERVARRPVPAGSGRVQGGGARRSQRPHRGRDPPLQPRSAGRLQRSRASVRRGPGLTTDRAAGGGP